MQRITAPVFTELHAHTGVLDLYELVLIWSGYGVTPGMGM